MYQSESMGMFNYVFNVFNEEKGATRTGKKVGLRPNFGYHHRDYSAEARDKTRK